MLPQLLALGALTLALLLVADALLARPPFPASLLWIGVDSLAHALAAPIIGRATTPRQALVLIALITAAAMLVDLDHFVAARSLRLESARNLQLRPARIAGPRLIRRRP